MKTNLTLLFSLVFITVMYGYSQDDKDPIAVDDYVVVSPLETIEIMVLENDYAYENHPFKILNAFGGDYGEFVKTDTSIIYTSGLISGVIDPLIYSIKDLENNMVSDFAKVYITINNDSYDYLDINGVRCRINSYGLQYWDLGYGNYEVPAGSGKSTIYTGSLWIGGLDENDALCLAADTRLYFGIDFSPGPVMDSLAYSSVPDIVLKKVWKLSSDEIVWHRQHWQDEGYEAIRNITRWPGNGDVSLGQAAQLASYYDWDGNGIYNPLAGDFPLIKGDQSVLTIVNDDRDLHTGSGGKKLGVEIQTAYYAYNKPGDSALKYTTFADQHIINRSQHAYHDVYAANLLDFNLGYPLDDFLCSDTLLHSAIVYNGTAQDGTGEPWEYGAHPPAQSFTCLNYPMDAFVYYSPFYGAPEPMTYPVFDTEYYSYLQALWKDSTPFTYGGYGYGGEQAVKYIFSGDPVSGEGWTEENAGNEPGDRRGLIVSGPHNLNPGDTLHLEYALVFARDYQGDHLSSVALLKTRIQEVRDFYQNALGIENSEGFKYELNLFPNPFTDVLNIEFSPTGQQSEISYSVFDILGEKVLDGSISGEILNTLDFSNLKAGIYFIRFNDGKNIFTRKVIREKM